MLVNTKNILEDCRVCYSDDERLPVVSGSIGLAD